MCCMCRLLAVSHDLMPRANPVRFYGAVTAGDRCGVRYGLAEVTARPTTEPDIRQPLGQGIGPAETPVRGSTAGPMRESQKTGRRARVQARTFSTSALKEALGREPANWWKTSPSRTTAKVGMERTP